MNELALLEAKQNYLRLRDDFTLQQYNILQEYPHTFEWRQTQMDQMKQVIGLSRGQNSSPTKQELLGHSQAKNFYLILDLEMPKITVTFQPVDASQGTWPIVSAVSMSRNSSVYVLKNTLRRILDSQHLRKTETRQLQLQTAQN